ncbi:MAG: mechanosensitive ion channel [Chloroflexi bacterium]|nr:mechanosensitive ion channel [Chloroflexota bacterium]MCI0579887.1 mechanosensitive ion channel [Chloroflexota bacterium]MCI0646168.1 mechanosensitive ion channel [Chloroflexota bacterium]MCI0729878.1 mechanosensitive ion channel [Chloroflexota bacterium]
MFKNCLFFTWLLLGLAVLVACTGTATPSRLPGALEEVTAEFLLFLPKIVAALVMFVVSLYLANLISHVLRRIMEKRRADPATVVLTFLITRWAIIILGTVAALRQVEFELTAFLAGLGILGFTVGFALQDISQNVVAGLLLLINKPFELGDLIEVENFVGNVRSVDLRSTELYTRDGHNVLIPNAKVFTTPIINYSRQATWRMNLTVGVANDSNLEEVHDVTLQAIRALPDVLEDPPPDLYFHTFNASSIDFTVRYWIDTRVTNPFTATHPAVIAIQRAFARTGIVIPFPTHTEIQLTPEEYRDSQRKAAK